MRLVYRLIAIILVASVAFGIKFYKRGNTGEQYLREARIVVAKADKYNQYREQFDWLVNTAHEDVFNDSYHMDFSRRHDDSWVDDEKYFDDLFTRMIELARNNSYYEVADSLERLADPDAEARQKAEKAAKRSGGKK